jgi:hypothetical protein
LFPRQATIAAGRRKKLTIHLKDTLLPVNEIKATMSSSSFSWPKTPHSYHFIIQEGILSKEFIEESIPVMGSIKQQARYVHPEIRGSPLKARRQ